MRLHGGAETLYLDYFTAENPFDADCLQSEQGTRFLRKFDRNMVCLLEEPCKKENEFFRWSTQGEMKRALLENYAVNTDARSVLVSGPWAYFKREATQEHPFAGNSVQEDFSRILAQEYGQPGREGLVSSAEHYLQGQREKLALVTEPVALDALEGWTFAPTVISAHDSEEAFEVRHYRVSAPQREKKAWDQPLACSTTTDLIVLLCQRQPDGLRFLLRPSCEIGLTGGVELGPSYKAENQQGIADWVQERVHDPATKTIVEVKQSDEGGRFMTSKCLYRLAEIAEGCAIEQSSYHWWVSINELERLCRSGKLLTNEARSVASLLLAFL